jgi:endonuclease/exonuclease/phosphatase family metal-dependent hydrolase
MKNFVRVAWIIFCIILTGIFIVACFSSYVSPDSFSYMPLLAIAFPYFFIAVLIVALINLARNKKLAVIMLVMLLLGFINLSHIIAFNFNTKQGASKNDSSLRIMTWNVQDFVDLRITSNTPSKMLNLIAKNNADIVCVQEFTNIEGAKKRVCVREKMDSLGYKYYFMSNDDYTVGKHVVQTRGTAVFSKIPFSDSGRININATDENENLVYVDINFKDKPLRIYTAHLKSFSLYKDTQNSRQDVYEITYNRKRTIQYKLRDVERFHQREVAIVHSSMAQTSLPVIYCGDLNAVPSSYTYHILRNNFQDAFLEKGSGIGATFYKIAPMLRIDYCFVDKRLKILNCFVINEKLSDHYPVVTDLQWK